MFDVREGWRDRTLKCPASKSPFYDVHQHLTKTSNVLDFTIAFQAKEDDPEEGGR